MLSWCPVKHRYSPVRRRTPDSSKFQLRTCSTSVMAVASSWSPGTILLFRPFGSCLCRVARHIHRIWDYCALCRSIGQNNISTDSCHARSTKCPLMSSSINSHSVHNTWARLYPRAALGHPMSIHHQNHFCRRGCHLSYFLVAHSSDQLIATKSCFLFRVCLSQSEVLCLASLCPQLLSHEFDGDNCLACDSQSLFTIRKCTTVIIQITIYFFFA